MRMFLVTILSFCLLAIGKVKISCQSKNELLKEYEKFQKRHKLMRCKNFDCFKSSIFSDLSPYMNGMSRKDWNTFRNDKTVILYQIINGNVYRERNCAYSARCLAIDSMLSKISSNLENTEFYVNFREISDQLNNERVPIFSHSRKYEHTDILMPTWSFVGAGPAIPNFTDLGIGKWNKLSGELYQLGKDIGWENKINQAFFRGSRKIKSRDFVVNLSYVNPNIYNAYYVKNQAWKTIKNSGGYQPVDFVSYEDHCNYKYLLDLPTFGSSTRSRHIFMCRSTIFRNDANYSEYWSKLLKPWVHYIPLKDDLSDIEEKIEFAISNKEIAKTIAEDGTEFVYELLKVENIKKYWILLLTQYTKTISWKVLQSPAVRAIPDANPYMSDEL